MTSLLRRKHRITAQNIAKKNRRLAAAGKAILAASMLIAGSIATASADDGTVQPGTRLQWHPVRPEHSEDWASANGSSSGDKSCSADKSCSDKNCIDKNCDADGDHPNKSSKGDVAVKRTVKRDSAVSQVDYHTDGTVDYQSVLKNKIKLASGQSPAEDDQVSQAGGAQSKKSSGVALTDPFGDNMPSVRSHRIAMVPPDEVDSMPAPTETQNSASPMRIEEQQDPAELTAPPQPLRQGFRSGR